jgi:hypothetical protein
MPAIASDNGFVLERHPWALGCHNSHGSDQSMSDVHVSRSASVGEPFTWLGALRHYVTFVACANLLWEIGHLPLYTIWKNGAWGEIAFAVAHCTGGDILIATTALLIALLVFGNAHWPDQRYWAVAAFALAVRFGYTAFSEWLNAIVRQSWTYTDAMPTIPAIGIGISPLAQWIVIPFAAFWLARRRSGERRRVQITEVLQ